MEISAPVNSGYACVAVKVVLTLDFDMGIELAADLLAGPAIAELKFEILQDVSDNAATELDIEIALGVADAGFDIVLKVAVAAKT